MTTENQYDDAELALFLQGKDELSHQLKALQQPMPSAALDAAILAKIEAALADEREPKAAANDPVGPCAGVTPAVRKPSFTARWRLPAGLAASVLIGVLLHRGFRSEFSSISVAMAPQAEGPRTLVKPTFKPVVNPAVNPAVNVTVNPTVNSAANPAVNPIVAQSVPHTNARAPMAPSAVVAQLTAPVAERPMQAAQPERAPPAMVAQAEPETVTVTGIRGALQQSLSQKRNSESHVAVITAEDIGKMPDKNVADARARPPGVSASSLVQSELDQKRNADSHIDAIAGANDRGGVASPPLPQVFTRALAPAAPTSAPSASQPPAPVDPRATPQTWLTLIADKLSAGSYSDALDEWTKFHLAHPNYPVAQALAEKITALQNSESQK
jgi:hypothetical protein